MPQLLNCVTRLCGADAGKTPTPRVNDLRFPHIGKYSPPHHLEEVNPAIRPLMLFKGTFFTAVFTWFVYVEEVFSSARKEHYRDVEVHHMDSPNRKHYIGKSDKGSATGHSNWQRSSVQVKTQGSQTGKPAEIIKSLEGVGCGSTRSSTDVC